MKVKRKKKKRGYVYWRGKGTSHGKGLKRLVALNGFQIQERAVKEAWRRQSCPLEPRWEPWYQAQRLSTETSPILPPRLRNSAGERCQADILHPDLPEHSTFCLSLCTNSAGRVRKPHWLFVKKQAGSAPWRPFQNGAPMRSPSIPGDASLLSSTPA